MVSNDKIIEDFENINNYVSGLMIDGKISKHVSDILNHVIHDYIIELQRPQPKKYVIRFNTKHNNETDLVWRVFENDVEHRVRGLDIRVPVSDCQTEENGETKYNIYCQGYMQIDDDDVAIISANYED